MTKKGEKTTRPILADALGTAQKFCHEKGIPENAYGPIDTDLARDNLENDIPYADLQDI